VAIDLELIKKNLRLSHSLEDELVLMYMEWAKDTVLSSVTTSRGIDTAYLETNMQYQKAVILLTSYYYENRLAIPDKKHTEMPYGVLDAIQKLRGNSKIHLEVADHEV